MATTPARFSEPMGASSSPAMFLLMAPVMKTLTTPLLSARSRIRATVPALSMAGEVFGIQTTDVNPPRAAAAVPVAIVSFAVCPGSRNCTCGSIKPGQTTNPFTSIRSISAGACLAASGARAATLPSNISRSATASNWLAGSMTRPPLRSSDFMRGGRIHRSKLTAHASSAMLRPVCGCSSMVEFQPSKLAMRVRSPPPAPLSLVSSVSPPATCVHLLEAKAFAAQFKNSVVVVLRSSGRMRLLGVKVITYHWTVIPIRRNRRTTGRGGSTYAAFKLEDDWQSLPAGKSGRVSSDEYWERITTFLQKVIPVARQHDVKMACHPYDPPGLPFGYQGADNWDAPSVFAAIKRYEAVLNSPYNGFQLRLETTGAGSKNPNTEILPIVLYRGDRGKIHQVHMR